MFEEQIDSSIQIHLHISNAANALEQSLCLDEAVILYINTK